MRILIKVIPLVLLFAVLGYASNIVKTGTVSIFILKDGKPLKNNEVIIDESKNFKTDSDGWIQTKIEVGKHQLQVYGKESNGLNLGYIKKPFTVKRDRDTQIIASFTGDNRLEAISIDTPLASQSDSNGTKKDKSTGVGRLSGSVLISNSGKPIAGARVFVKGTTIDTRTDKSGQFSVEVPSGVDLSISVVHSAYSAQTVNEIIVQKGETISKTVKLTPASMELEEFVVLAPKIEGSIASVVSEKREDSAVAEILGSEQFSKQGDSDAAGALKRASGLTLVGGKYIFIRGLGERYSNSLLNTLALPSPNPTKRVVPLDMFPTSVVGSIKVQKTYSANLPANFGGGNIDIRTKDTPEKFFANLGLSLNYTQGTTFNDMLTSKTEGGIDFLGYDDTRELSQLTKDKIDIDHNFGSFDEDVANDLLKNPSSIESITATPGYKFSVNFGDSYKVGQEGNFGYFASYSYGSDWDSKDLYTRKATFDKEGEKLTLSDYQKSSIYERTYKHGGLFGLTYDYNDNHNYKLTNFYINIADDSISQKDYRSDGDARKYTTSWFERSLIINQLSGVDYFPALNDLKVEWAIEYGNAYANEPLTKFYNFKKADEVDFYVLDNDKINYQNNELEDTLMQYKIDFNYPFEFLSEEESSVSVGAMMLNKERDAQSRRFALFFDTKTQFSQEELTTGIDDFTMDDFSKVNLSSRPTESYTANHDILAYYVMTNLKPTEKIEVEVGVRSEDSTQDVTSYQNDAETNELISDKVLPSLSASYKLNDDMQFRFGYAQTVTRPDFREFADTRYQDPTTADVIYGNKYLTFTDLTHIDFRYEWYINDSDNITAGIFYKDIEHPIETVVFYTDVDPLFTYINAQDASLYGIEFTWRKSLDIIKEGLEKYSLSGNYSYTKSEITIFDDLTGHVKDSLKATIGDLTTKNRPMQGQSEHVVNLQLGYNDKKLNSTLLYNVIGERIVNLGTEGFPDVYEQPFHQLDFVASYKLNSGFKVGLKVKNLLDSEVTWKQGDDDIRKYKKGRDFNINGSYKF